MISPLFMQHSKRVRRCWLSAIYISKMRVTAVTRYHPCQSRRKQVTAGDGGDALGPVLAFCCEDHRHRAHNSCDTRRRGTLTFALSQCPDDFQLSKNRYSCHLGDTLTMLLWRMEVKRTDGKIRPQIWGATS